MLSFLKLFPPRSSRNATPAPVPAALSATNSTLENTALRDELLAGLIKARVVIVTGTGVSLQASGFPSQPGTNVASWKGLLENGIAYCNKYGLLSSKSARIAQLHLESPATTNDYIDAAQIIHDALSIRRNARIHWINETIGQLKVFDPSLIKAINNLGSLITTLNYDDLLYNVTGRTPVHWMEQEKIDDYIHSGSADFILHIHGHWKTVVSMVLDRTSYINFSQSKKMQDLLHGFARWNTLLFIGCGGTFLDPNFDMLIKWCDEALKDSKHRHFILCRSADESGYIEMLQSYGFLQPLVYGANYSDLTSFLNKLAIDSGSSVAASNPPIPPSPAGLESGNFNVQKASDIWTMQNPS